MKSLCIEIVIFSAAAWLIALVWAIWKAQRDQQRREDMAEAEHIIRSWARSRNPNTGRFRPPHYGRFTVEKNGNGNKKQ